MSSSIGFNKLTHTLCTIFTFISVKSPKAFHRQMTRSIHARRFTSMHFHSSPLLIVFDHSIHRRRRPLVTYFISFCCRAVVFKSVESSESTFAVSFGFLVCALVLLQVSRGPQLVVGILTVIYPQTYTACMDTVAQTQPLKK